MKTNNNTIRPLEIQPTHNFVKSYVFQSDEIAEVKLADAVAEVAEKNGLSANDMSHLFPAILRILNSKSNWSGTT